MLLLALQVRSHADQHNKLGRQGRNALVIEVFGGRVMGKVQDVTAADLGQAARNRNVRMRGRTWTYVRLRECGLATATVSSWMLRDIVGTPTRLYRAETAMPYGLLGAMVRVR